MVVLFLSTEQNRKDIQHRHHITSPAPEYSTVSFFQQIRSGKAYIQQLIVSRYYDIIIILSLPIVLCKERTFDGHEEVI